MKSILKYSLLSLFIAALAITIICLLFADAELSSRIVGMSTVILAFLTSAYVILTYQILRSTRPQPHIFVSLPTDEEDFDLSLSIKNIGNRPAYDLIVTIEPSLDILAPTPAFKGATLPMLNQPFMPPQSEIRNSISHSLQVHSLPPEKKIFKVRLQYKDYVRRKYSDSYCIDLGSYIFEKKFHQPKGRKS